MAYVEDPEKMYLKVMLPKDWNQMSKSDIEEFNKNIESSERATLIYHGLKSCADGKFQRHDLDLDVI